MPRWKYNTVNVSALPSKNGGAVPRMISYSEVTRCCPSRRSLTVPAASSPSPRCSAPSAWVAQTSKLPTGWPRYSEPMSPRTCSRFQTYPRWNSGSAMCPPSMWSRIVVICISSSSAPPQSRWSRRRSAPRTRLPRTIEVDDEALRGSSVGGRMSHAQNHRPIASRRTPPGRRVIGSAALRPAYSYAPA